MDYERLIREAWQITWRHPYLWVLGLFAGGAAVASVGGGGGDGAPSFSGWRGEPRSRGALIPSVDLNVADIGHWATDHLGLILAIIAVTVLTAVVLLVVSLIAQGGMAGATADLASGRSSSLGHALRTGAHLFWRYAGLWLMLGLAVAIIGAVVAIFVAFVA